MDMGQKLGAEPLCGGSWVPIILAPLKIAPSHMGDLDPT